MSDVSASDEDRTSGTKESTTHETVSSPVITEDEGDSSFTTTAEKEQELHRQYEDERLYNSEAYGELGEAYVFKEDPMDPYVIAKKRLRALKLLETRITELESRFYHEVHTLERLYNAECSVFRDVRSDVVSGQKNLVKDALAEEDDVLNEVASKWSASQTTEIKDFWLTVFKNSSTLCEYVTPEDEAIFAHLEDVKLDYTADPLGFTLEFHFSPNLYFSNKVLTKEYHANNVPSPFKQVPEIHRGFGCTIDWFPGRDTTLKTVKKRQIHRTSGHVRKVERPRVTGSFFNFFNSPPKPIEPKMSDCEKTRLKADYELGQYFKTTIVPYAYFYFIGQVTERVLGCLDTDSPDESSSQSNDSY